MSCGENRTCYAGCDCREADWAARLAAAERARDDHFALRLLAEVERDRLRERLDQFDAHGFPNVAAALDRVNAAEARAERAERERDAFLLQSQQRGEAYDLAAAAHLAAESRAERAEAALREIEESRGLWADDAAQFQRNRIDNMVNIAKRALAEVDRG